MAKRLPFTLLPGQEEFILQYVNQISDPSEITDGTQLKDDPFYDGAGGYTIGEKVATKIIKAKEKLPRGRFITVQQILDIRGVGPDKIRDIMTSFWKPAADDFQERLTTNILLDNWKVEHWSFDFQYEEDEFKNLAIDNCALRNFIANKIREIVRNKQDDYTISNLAYTLVNHLPMEKFETEIATTHMFALWWYRFDEDNWFSFETILSEVQQYFTYYQRNGLELVMLKGFVNGGTLAEAVTPKDLPVVINHGERRITIWAASLFD